LGKDQEILSFIRSLDTPETHGYNPQAGYRVYTAKAVEIASAGSWSAPQPD
jgi:arginine decarboxylase